MNYTDTLNIPSTTFSMKANLATMEPIRIGNHPGMYQRLSAKPGAIFSLHDGPPYANGPIHIGHAMNKIIKDIIINSNNLQGHSTKYVPGWDCHGLPIETAVEKKHGKKADNFLGKCSAYAMSQVEIQKEGFKRLGVLADWENPYLTMNKHNESKQLEAFEIIFNKGYVYQGFKPVHWCMDCQSSLAEFEVEQEKRTIDTVYLAFEANDGKKLVAWTTTPWTIPGNQALNVNNTIQYVLVNDTFIVANSLVQSFAENCGIAVVETMDINIADYKEVKSAITKKIVPVIHAEYVTDRSGTGIVHVAPSHGQEDYKSFVSHTKESILHTVGANGTYMNTGDELNGMHITKAYETIKRLCDIVGEKKISMNANMCWRHKTPTIMRATPQWFISLDGGLRDLALTEIEKVNFHPETEKNRLKEMVRTRGDWCISRQRKWGVPIPFFLHKDTGALHPDYANHMKSVISMIAEHGVEVWQTVTNETFGVSEEYVKSSDILEVWFDSGSSFYHVMNGEVSDVYFEGNDQHRGWFQSSLLLGCAILGHAPFKTVITHGFVVDGNGKKMGKSEGNVIDPNDVCKKYGAEVLRLWAASSDYTKNMEVDDKVLKRVSENYRKIRNTIRYLLSVTSDYDGTVGDLSDIEKYAISHVNSINNKIIKYYNEFNIYKVVVELTEFVNDWLSGFYMDVCKNILYCNKVESIERRNVQYVLNYITNTLLAMLAPILRFTIEEACEAGNIDYYGLSLGWKTWYVDNSMNSLMVLRSEVMSKIQAFRDNGEISLSTECVVQCPTYGVDPDIIARMYKVAEVYEHPEVIVSKHNGTQCPRCRDHFVYLTADKLCNNCAEVMA